MVHLSVRLPWHDSGWNGCICKYPHLNASCIGNETIRDERDDDREREFAETHVSELDGWLPPCSRDILTYSSVGRLTTHQDPLSRYFLRPIQEEIPPYTSLPAPYWWLREENFQDICEDENLSIRMGENLGKKMGWIYEPDRQLALLNHFWGKIKEGEGHSLIFFYVKENPVDEDAPRLIVGVGRLKNVGPQLFFKWNKSPQKHQFPIWTRAITQDYPNQGFRLPYQEYIQLDEDPKRIACYVPKESILQFSFVSEHISDDQAVGILEHLIQSVKTVEQDNKVPGPWKRQLEWLDRCLEDVWASRGPYPGIGPVLNFLGFPQGMAFHRIELRNFVKEGKDPWHYVKAILNEQQQPPMKYRDSFKQAKLRWRSFGKKPVRQELLNTVVKFELTSEQIRRLMDVDERVKSGIEATDEELIVNPYIICESDLGSSKSNPISLDTIDRGMLPEGNFAYILSRSEQIAQDDSRRVRAVATTVLKEAAESGDTLLSVSELFEKIRARFPERRECKPDRDIFEAEADFYQPLLWLSFGDKKQALIALANLRIDESEIEELIKRRTKRTNPVPTPPIDWDAALTAEFDKPQTVREKAAHAEKVIALETLFTQRISVLTGSAGTGKTSVLKVFLDCLGKTEGQMGVRLLAPTGKARVRLSTATQRSASTIHQFLLSLDWIQPDIFVLKSKGGKQVAPSTVIIDECSMVPTDLLAVLLRAIKMDLVKRLILVGDPNQLPPIGPGRPFVDIINWLRKKHPQCVATLQTSMRIVDDCEGGLSSSYGLAFAEGYRDDLINPADDEILSEIARGIKKDDLEVHFWNDQDELQEVIRKCLADVGIGEEGDYVGFNESLGICAKLNQQVDWRGAENWQLLSPLRGKGFGTEELNRMIQFGYRRKLIKTAQSRSNTPSPFGNQQIVWTDKVIQIKNQKRYGWPRDTGMDYVANGEIGIVTKTAKSGNIPYLQVGFSTQNGVTYRYYGGEVENVLELAYALTVHKSQGSDFETVFLIVPKAAQTLSRELIYTGLTRFKKKLVLLIEGDTETLERLRSPEHSDTHLRNTMMFSVSLRMEDKKAYYPDSLIHITKLGIPVRSKSEAIVADTLTNLGISWEYEQKLAVPEGPRDFRLPDFTIGYEGDILYWEHLGMLTVPSYREGWERKQRWYEEKMGIPVIGEGVEAPQVEPGQFPIVITSRDNEDGGIDVPKIESLIRKYILLED